jgi:hypothetical protein
VVGKSRGGRGGLALLCPSWRGGGWQAGTGRGHVGEELGTEGSRGGRELEREGTREEGGCREGAGGTEPGREGGTAPGRAQGRPGREGGREGRTEERGGWRARQGEGSEDVSEGACEGGPRREGAC